ncbi:serine--tRNA ligase [Candidatus Woesearchaeota archaeon]|nr:serine--tRNA ligase [Candidatus Woesearchaeota archaeon]
MIDINLIRENSKLVKDNQKKKNKDDKVVDEALSLDGEWKKVLKKVEELKSNRNKVSLEINAEKKQGKSAAGKIKEMKGVVDEITKLDLKANELLRQRNLALSKIDNLMHEKVPKGKDESENKEIRKWGTKPAFKFEVKNHVELIEGLGIGDFDAASKSSGKGFYFLKGDLGMLNQALIQLAVEFMSGRGYVYVEPPLMLRKEVLGGALDLAEFEKTIYSVEGEDLALIGTSEYSLLGMHVNNVIEVPKKYFAYSMCFRKEVGAHGVNEKGLWRTHQFNKVEQFVFCAPSESWKYFDEMAKNTEELMQALELPYRVVEICSGDLSAWKARSLDVEVWRPTLKDYGEVASLSNCTDYQSRNLGIKFVDKEMKRQFVHTLNNTVLATSRIMVAILENFQTEKGTVRVPKALWPYMNGVKELKSLGK